MAEVQGDKEDDTIVGLRTQIFANAAALYPDIVASHATYTTTGVVKADQIFDIIVMAHERIEVVNLAEVKCIRHQATLTYGKPLSRKVAANSGAFDTTTEALRNLLQVTSRLLSMAEEFVLDLNYCGETVGACGGSAEADLLPEGLVRYLMSFKGVGLRKGKLGGGV